MSNRHHWGAWFRACAMAALPLGLWLLIHWLMGDRRQPTVEVARELLFFSLSTCSLSIAESPRRAPSALNSCLGVTIVGACLYGAFLIGEALHDAVMIRNAYHASIFIAPIALGVGTWNQWNPRQESSYVL